MFVRINEGRKESALIPLHSVGISNRHQEDQRPTTIFETFLLIEYSRNPATKTSFHQRQHQRQLVLHLLFIQSV